MEIFTLAPDSFAANCYLLAENGHALVIDPGVSVEAIVHALKRTDAILDGILLTHGHFDHVLSLEPLCARFPNATVYLHPDDRITLERDNAHDIILGQPRHWNVDHRFAFLTPDNTPRLANIPISYLHTPGHTPGSVCYRCQNALFTGDTIFANGYGRTDLPGGNSQSLTHSLLALSTLSGNLSVYPGHGAKTTLHRALANLGIACDE